MTSRAAALVLLLAVHVCRGETIQIETFISKEIKVPDGKSADGQLTLSSLPAGYPATITSVQGTISENGYCIYSHDYSVSINGKYVVQKGSKLGSVSWSVQIELPATETHPVLQWHVHTYGGGCDLFYKGFLAEVHSSSPHQPPPTPPAPTCPTIQSCDALSGSGSCSATNGCGTYTTPHCTGTVDGGNCGSAPATPPTRTVTLTACGEAACRDTQTITPNQCSPVRDVCSTSTSPIFYAVVEEDGSGGFDAWLYSDSTCSGDSRSLQGECGACVGVGNYHSTVGCASEGKPSSSKTQILPIVLGSVGGLVAVLIGIAAVYYFCIRRPSQATEALIDERMIQHPVCE